MNVLKITKIKTIIFFLLISLKSYSQNQYLDLIEIGTISVEQLSNGDSVAITVNSNQYVRINDVFLTVELTGTSGMLWNNLDSYVQSNEFCAKLLGQCLVSNNDLLAKYQSSRYNSVLNSGYFGGRTVDVKNEIDLTLPKGVDAIIYFNLSGSNSSSSRSLNHNVLVSYEIYE